MVKKYKKFILKMPEYYRDKLYELEQKILRGENLENYDVIPCKGFKNQFRVRIGDYRIIFEEKDSQNKIIKINKRGDIY